MAATSGGQKVRNIFPDRRLKHIYKLVQLEREMVDGHWYLGRQRAGVHSTEWAH